MMGVLRGGEAAVKSKARLINWISRDSAYFTPKQEYDGKRQRNSKSGVEEERPLKGEGNPAPSNGVHRQNHMRNGANSTRAVKSERQFEKTHLSINAAIRVSQEDGMFLISSRGSKSQESCVQGLDMGHLNRGLERETR